MTRRMRIDDLTASRSRPSRRCRRTARASSTCCARSTREAGPQRRPALDRAGRRRYAAPPHLRHQRHRTGLVAGRHPARVPRATARCTLLAGRRRRARAGHRPAARRRRPGLEPGRRADRVQRRRRPDRRGNAARWSPDRSTTRPTAPACSARSAASSTCSTSPPATCRQLTDGDHAGEPAWSPDGSTLAFTRKVGADSDLTFRTAVHLLDVDDPKATPRAVALEDGIAATVSFTRRRREPARRRLARRPGVGHAHLLRVPLDGGDAGRPHRPPRPQRDARRPGVPRRPARRDRRRPAALLPPRPRLHPPLVRTTTTGPVLAGDGRVVSGLSVAGATAVVALATPDVVRRDRRARPRDRRRDRAHRPRRQPRRRRAVRPRGAHVHDLRRHRGAGLAGPRPRARAARGRCCSTSTAARTTRGTPPPTRCTSTTRSSPPAAGRCCWSTRAAATATARRSTTACSGAWGVADANDFLEPIDAARRRGPRRPRPARGHRLQLRRLHDLLPDRPRRPVRGRRRRRRRQRPGEHVRHLRRRRAA